MTQTLPGADIRGFYAALGINLPGWARDEVTVRCFADPEAHRRGDRDPSCSVNLTHGAWNCHGCGASGGPFDAAISCGRTSRSAIDLMVCHGLTKRRAQPSLPRRDPTSRGAYRCPRVKRRATAGFTVSETDIQRWCKALELRPPIVDRLLGRRGWRLATMRELELGVDRGRVTIPVRDHRHRLVGLLRYRPWPAHGQIKMRAALGSRRQLLPDPCIEPSATFLLVEGEPDMIAARSRGLPAIDLPGVDSWKDDWAAMFAGRHVTIAMDCDPRGRAGAQRIAEALREFVVVRVVDLEPARHDGYDLTDWFLDGSPGAETIDLGCPVNARSGDGD
jgi:hypothetical protein